MKVVLTAALILATFPALSQAGECVRSDDYYLECLEGSHTDDADLKEPSGCLACVDIPRQLYQRWGFEGERAQLFSKQTYAHRDRLIAVAEKQLGSKDNCLVAAQVLAFQGVQDAAGEDIFQLLTTAHLKAYASLWYTLAALQDKRTIRYAERCYLEASSQAAAGSSVSRGEALDIIDCLYHFRSDESRVVLRRLAANERDTELRQYIERVAGV